MYYPEKNMRAGGSLVSQWEKEEGICFPSFSSFVLLSLFVFGRVGQFNSISLLCVILEGKQPGQGKEGREACQVLRK